MNVFFQEENILAHSVFPLFRIQKVSLFRRQWILGPVHTFAIFP